MIFAAFAVLVLVMTPSFVAADLVSAPLEGLTDDELARFVVGTEAFTSLETPEDGLGPVFNAAACAACHTVGGTGGGSEIRETRFGRLRRSGTFDPLAELGGSLIDFQSIGASGTIPCAAPIDGPDGETVPTAANVVSGRRTTPLFGLGLVDAVPESTFWALAARQARRTPKTAGRPNVVEDVVHRREDGSPSLAVGRLGWKGQMPSLHQFAGGAYKDEMGITNELFPDENCPNGDCSLLACDAVPDPESIADETGVSDVDRFTDFMRMLAPVAPLPGALEMDGAQVFRTVGCARCHVTTLVTGPSDIEALAFQVIHPFSDFLLHDMGSLGDGIGGQGEATPTEMRTAPLWGARLLTTFLHDGRATTVEQAIAAHDGQGARARDAFAALPDWQQQQLLAFVGSL